MRARCSRAFSAPASGCPKNAAAFSFRFRMRRSRNRSTRCAGSSSSASRLVATHGTHDMLQRYGIPVEPINAIAEGSPNVLDAIAKRTVDLVINNAGGARRDRTDNFRIRRAAVEASIACLTSLDTAAALATALASEPGPPRSLQEYQAAAPRDDRRDDLTAPDARPWCNEYARKRHDRGTRVGAIGYRFSRARRRRGQRCAGRCAHTRDEARGFCASSTTRTAR